MKVVLSRPTADSPNDAPPPNHIAAPEWARIKAVFLAAVERSEADRLAFLESACAGDDALRHEVQSLLASDAASVSFCDSPAAAVLLRGAAALHPRLRPGTRLGSYEITEFIATGGMGDVYRARHTVLGRVAAVKTVRSDYGDEAAQRRLLREAKHAAALNHPGICTIHEAGNNELGPYVAMEFVEGRSLHVALRDGLPRISEVLEYGIQIADALGHAHRLGVIHRDLKSSNVMVAASGRVVILDFGLARRMSGPGDAQSMTSTITQLGTLAGTLSHMAPEVLLGRDADERSDLWSLGILLYELVTGALPFRGRTPYETTSAILNEPVPGLPRDVPLALRLVIERCLMKEPAERFQNAVQVSAAMDAIRRRRSLPLLGPLLVAVRRRTLALAATMALVTVLVVTGGWYGVHRLTGFGSLNASSLAVLPFTNATSDPAEQYYADGLTDELVAQLGAATDVRIVSPVSARRVAASAHSAADIAQRLGVTAIVQGTVERVNNDVRVGLKLVRPSDGRVVWSSSFARREREVLALQADMVRALALEVRMAVRPDARQRLSAVRAVDPEVYEEYLKGLAEWRQRTEPSLNRAIEHFTRAAQLDPTYAPAHAALADCFNQFGTVLLGTGSPSAYRPRAEDAAIKALQIDPYSAEAHASLGYVRHYNWQWAEAEREFRRAIELNPSYPLARIWYANLLMSVRRSDEALAQVYAARELDPFSLIVKTNVGWVLHDAGRLEDAARELQETLALDSTYAQAHWRLAYVRLAQGRRDEARAEVQRVLLLTDSSSSALGMIANMEVRDGREDNARAILQKLLARADTSYVAPGWIGNLYRALGQHDSALHWLTKAFDERSNALAFNALDTAAYPGDARWRALIARVPPRP